MIELLHSSEEAYHQFHSMNCQEVTQNRTFISIPEIAPFELKNHYNFVYQQKLGA